MPIYEYRCEKCEATFEQIRKISEDSKETKCPECDQVAQKVIGGTSFRLKGSGWYRNTSNLD